jgi:hypothetical protein
MQPRGRNVRFAVADETGAILLLLLAAEPNWQYDGRMLGESDWYETDFCVSIPFNVSLSFIVSYFASPIFFFLFAIFSSSPIDSLGYRCCVETGLPHLLKYFSSKNSQFGVSVYQALLDIQNGEKNVNRSQGMNFLDGC